jgi:shikimate kinase
VRIETFAVRNRQLARFNEAVTLANQGDWKRAMTLCDALLVESLDDELRSRVQELRARTAPLGGGAEAGED